MTENQPVRGVGPTDNGRPSQQGPFLRQVRHDLRNSLHAIIGLSEALQLQVCGPLTARQATSLKTIEDSGTALFHRLENLLELLRLDSDGIELERREVDVGLCCREAVQKIGSRSHGKQRKISLVTEELPSLQAEPKMLQWLLDNILKNSLRCSPEGSDISVAVSVLEQEAMVAITFTHTDNPGQMRDVIDTALVQRIAEVHGGRLELGDQGAVESSTTVLLPFE